MSDEKPDTANTSNSTTRSNTTTPGDLYGVAPSLAKSPLGIIALFILLVYAISGIVCATWKPPVPEALVWFIVLFPVLVFGVFTWLVVEHHLKLYGPGDFNDQRHWLTVQQAIADAAKAMDSLQPVISQTELPPEVNVLDKLDHVQAEIAKRTGVDLSRPQSSRPPKPLAPAARASVRMEEEDLLEVDGVRRVVEIPVAQAPLVANDPQKGQWGGKRDSGHYHVEVAGHSVVTLAPGIFRLLLRVYSSDPARPLTRPVVLHLHNSFNPKDRAVAPAGGEVRFPMVLWGSFTVGVEITEPDAMGTMRTTALEIDLADPDIASDQTFKER